MRDNNLRKQAHLLNAPELKRRGITRYDAEILLSQGMMLPEPHGGMRAKRRLPVKKERFDSRAAKSTSNQDVDRKQFAHSSATFSNTPKRESCATRDGRSPVAKTGNHLTPNRKSSHEPKKTRGRNCSSPSKPTAVRNDHSNANYHDDDISDGQKIGRRIRTSSRSVLRVRTQRKPKPTPKQPPPGRGKTAATTDASQKPTSSYIDDSVVEQTVPVPQPTGIVPREVSMLDYCAVERESVAASNSTADLDIQLSMSCESIRPGEPWANERGSGSLKECDEATLLLTMVSDCGEPVMPRRSKDDSDEPMPLTKVEKYNEAPSISKNWMDCLKSIDSLDSLRREMPVLIREDVAKGGAADFNASRAPNNLVLPKKLEMNDAFEKSTSTGDEIKSNQTVRKCVGAVGKNAPKQNSVAVAEVVQPPLRAQRKKTNSEGRYFGYDTSEWKVPKLTILLRREMQEGEAAQGREQTRYEIKKLPNKKAKLKTTGECVGSVAGKTANRSSSETMSSVSERKSVFDMFKPANFYIQASKTGTKPDTKPNSEDSV